MNDLFFVTDVAATAAKNRLEKRNTPDATVRVGVRGGGCSGLTYCIEFEDNEPRKNDLVLESGGVKFAIDPKSLAYLRGTTLDYVKTLAYEGFKFNNPQQAATCGCGSSFSVK